MNMWTEFIQLLIC